MHKSYRIKGTENQSNSRTNVYDLNFLKSILVLMTLIREKKWERERFATFIDLFEHCKKNFDKILIPENHMSLDGTHYPSNKRSVCDQTMQSRQTNQIQFIVQIVELRVVLRNWII